MRFIDIPNDSFTINMMSNMIEPEEGEDIQVDPKNQRLSDCLVEMHVAVRDLNTALQKRGKKFNYITPRDFIDLVHHFEDLHE
jgi:dynein heavy chain 1